MDKKYIENEHVVDRYLAGELTVREARDFEQYCLEHPEALREMPIPVRLKARLARRPADDSETGVFKAIPSSVTRAALEATDDGFDPDEEREEIQQSRSSGVGGSRLMAFGLLIALLGALAGTVHYAMKVGTLESKIKQMERAQRAVQMQAPSSQAKYRVQPARARPEQPTVAIGWSTPPQLIDLHIDVTQTKFQQFQITIDKVDGGRVMQLRRIARDSNGEVRIGLNSSAFGPGDYLMKIEGLTWKGQPQEYGWVMLGLQ
jgi:hypothetical protein